MSGFIGATPVTFLNPSTSTYQLGDVDAMWSGVILRGISPYTVSITRDALNPHTTVEKIVNISGSGAAAEAIINTNGQVIGVNITNQGINYRLPPKIVFIPQESAKDVFFKPTGQGASATTILNTDTGSVGGVIITNPGSGYTIPPKVSFVSYSDITQDQMIFAYPDTSGSLPDGVGIGNVRFKDSNSIAITFFNLTDEVIAGDTLNYNIWSLDSIMPMNSLLALRFSYTGFNATGSNFAPQTSSVPIRGMIEEDLILSAFPVTTAEQEEGVGCWQGAIAADNGAYIRYTGPAEAWTPPDSIVNMHVLMAYSFCPMIIWQQLVKPYAIPAGQVREFIFTIPFFGGYSDAGGFFAWASKPSHTQGITLAGCRVANSGTTIGVCLQNCSTKTITPPAEVYTFCVVPLPIVDISTGQVTDTMSLIDVPPSNQKLLSSHNEVLRSLGLLGLIGGG